ncbi:MAG TPA: tyrosine-type recombinase/integrase [Streptosporangiaceae bacterium]|nr:tyrosine-type recombinase/integrase [Streptosporangiaceae bacterium]
MATTSTSTAVAAVESVFTEREWLALAGFLAGYTGLTREAYALDLRQFASWCQQHQVRLFQVRRADIECFARDLENRGRARATITRRLCTVAGFYRYAVEEELLDHSPAAHVRRPRLDYESHATGLDRNELGALLVAAGLGAPTEHALISLLALNGLRVSEAVGADIEALGVERGHRTLVVVRKGGKVVTIPLAPRTARAIDLAIGERAGITKPVGPHTLRHAFITAALDAGVPLRDVQEAASHADPRTTMSTTVLAAAWTGTRPTSSPPTSPVLPGKNELPGSKFRLAGPQRPGGGLPAVESAGILNAGPRTNGQQVLNPAPRIPLGTLAAVTTLREERPSVCPVPARRTSAGMEGRRVR